MKKFCLEKNDANLTIEFYGTFIPYTEFLELLPPIPNGALD